MKHSPTMRVILAALANEPLTVRQICEVCKLNYKSLYATSPNTLEALRRNGDVRIVEWVRSSAGKGGAHSAVYELGKGRDAPNPGTLTHSEKWDRRKHKVKYLQLLKTGLIAAQTGKVKCYKRRIAKDQS